MNEIDVISEVANELVLAVEEAMKDLPGTANNMPFVQLLIEYKEMMELFEAQQNAYYRATELWRSKTPGKERTFPDVANLTLFLLEQNDEQASEIAALEAKLAAAERLFVKCTRFDIYLGGYGDHYLYKQHDGRWYEADSEQYFDTPLEAFESLQKENADA